MEQGYVPIKERSIRSEELSPMLTVCPTVCTDLRLKMYTWYPGPEICGHRLHWTEWVFLSFFLAALICVLAFDTIMPLFFYGLFLTVCGGMALVFVWGFAKYKSIAQTAENLERVAIENHGQVDAYQKINREWDRSLQQSDDNIKSFARELGVIEDDTNKLADLERGLTGLVDQKKKIQGEEKALHEVSILHQKVTRANLEETQRTQMKTRLLRFYSKIDRSGDKNGVIDSDAEVAELRAALQKDDFLNTIDETTGKPRFNWEAEFNRAAHDLPIYRWELLEALDRATDSYFLQIQNAVEREQELIKQHQQLQDLAAKQQQSKSKKK